MIKAILFDSDGVLVDSEQIFFDATREAFAQAGAEIDARKWARWYLSEGRHSADIARELGISESRIDGVIRQRNADFYGRIARGVPVMPGVPDVLESLCDTYRLAVVTGADREHFDLVHRNTGLVRFFETVVTRDDCRDVKPAPEAYLTVLDRLELRPKECLAVEDSPRGAVAAVAAGITCVVLRTALTDVFLCPPQCTVIDDMSQISVLAGAAL